MFIVTGGRRSGKTLFLINAFLQDPTNSVIVCHSEQEARRLRDIVHERLGYSVPGTIVTYKEAIASRAYGSMRRLLVDNLDLYFGDNVVATASGTSVHLDEPPEEAPDMGYADEA